MPLTIAATPFHRARMPRRLVRAAPVLSLASALLSAAVPAAALTIQRAVVTLDAKRGDGFVLKGRFTPSTASGIDTVELDVGSFSEAMPIARFRSRRGRLRLKGSRKRSRVRSLTVDVAKGKFAAVVKRIRWAALDNPAGVRLVAGSVDECSTLVFRETPKKLTLANAVPACAFAGPPRTNPSAILVGSTPADIRVQVRVLPGVPLDAPTVAIVQLDTSLNPLGDPLAELRDDGDPAMRDEVAGDGIFSCVIHVLESPPARLRIAAQASVGGIRVLSPSSVIDVVVPPTDQDIMVLLDGQAVAGEIWEAAFARYGDTQRARQESVSAIALLPGVASAEITPDGSIYIRYVSGLAGGLMLDPPGTPGSGDVPGVPVPTALPERTPAVLTARPPVTPSEPRGTAEGPRIGNNKVLVWSPFYHESFNTRTTDALLPILRKATCPQLDLTVLKDEECTLDSIGTFSEYGTVVLITHGAVVPGGTVAFMSGEKAAFLSQFTRRAELASEAIFVYNGQRSPEKKGYFVFRPSFVASSLPSSIPLSVVFAAACSSAANRTMANAFLGGNALAYLGFSSTTFGPFMEYTAPLFFGELALKARNAGDAYAAVPNKVTREWFPTTLYSQSDVFRSIVKEQELSSKLELVLGDRRLGYRCEPAAPGLVDTISVPATPMSHAVGSVRLEEGGHYRLVIAGTGREQLDADFHEYDAFYCFTSSAADSPCATPGGFPIDSPLGFFLQVADEVSSLQQPAEFTGQPRPAYNGGHSYELRFSPGIAGKLYVGTFPSSCGGCTWPGSFTVQIFRE
jgi:hypothetical protein